MTRSFPEKTLEHWCSMHLSYRYRAKLLMWWPASDADIEVIKPKGGWGKRFWLELKTTEWKPGRNGRHELSIDLPQLAAYGAQSIPDYYVFPIPPWEGILGEPASLAWLDKPRERLAYGAQSDEKWFAEWTYVVPGRLLRKRLHAALAALPNGKKKQAHRIATIKKGVLHPDGPALTNKPYVLWRDFWAHQDVCGSQQWPAQYVLQPGTVQVRNPKSVSRAMLATGLRSLRDGGTKPAFSSNVDVFSPTQDGDEYQLLTASDFGRYDDFQWDSGHRSLQLLTEQAIRGD